MSCGLELFYTEVSAVKARAHVSRNELYRPSILTNRRTTQDPVVLLQKQGKQRHVRSMKGYTQYIVQYYYYYRNKHEMH
jgi:hypothetical protein